jgi:hypothetical protein
VALVTPWPKWGNRTTQFLAKGVAMASLEVIESPYGQEGGPTTPKGLGGFSHPIPAVGGFVNVLPQLKISEEGALSSLLQSLFPPITISNEI